MSDVLPAIADQLYKNDARIKELETENAALLAANRDLQLHFEAMWDDRAAAVAERDELREALYSIDGTLRSAVAAMGRAIERAERAEARLAAIDAAPTVAVVWFAKDANGNARGGLDYGENLPPIGTELIVRPAKE